MKAIESHTRISTEWDRQQTLLLRHRMLIRDSAEMSGKLGTSCTARVSTLRIQETNAFFFFVCVFHLYLTQGHRDGLMSLGEIHHLFTLDVSWDLFPVTKYVNKAT